MPMSQHSHVESASALAVVAASNEPLLFMTDDLRVIAASSSFCTNFEVDPATVAGRPLAEIGGGEWAAPRIVSLLNATATSGAQINAYEMDLTRRGKPTRHLVLTARKLEDGDECIRLLLTVTDVTEVRTQAKLKDDLVRDKQILLQEVQHRVANSLQIIASVLMQSARKVQSDEARGPLHDAHNRIMSIAAVQRQLAEANATEVALRPYLEQLCHSLGASMIRDHAQLSIKVDVDSSVVSADASISIGLIVTELVINALKHGYPHHRHGVIHVGYHAKGPNWVLTVEDDGVGMPTGAATPKPGLGSGIVEALAGQLRCVVTVDSAKPGTSVSMVHDEGAADVIDVSTAA